MDALNIQNKLITFNEAKSLGKNYYDSVYLPSKTLIYGGETQTTACQYQLSVLESYLQTVKQTAANLNYDIPSMGIRIYNGRYPVGFPIADSLIGKNTVFLIPVGHKNGVDKIDHKGTGFIQNLIPKAYAQSPNPEDPDFDPRFLEELEDMPILDYSQLIPPPFPDKTKILN